MKIIYLKKTHNANVGDICELRDDIANVLIKIKVVKKYSNEEVKENKQDVIDKKIEESQISTKVIKKKDTKKRGD